MRRTVAAAAVLVALPGCGGASLESPRPGERTGSCSAVETTDDEGTAHLEPAKTTKYPSFPPSSGPHDPTWLPAGVYARPLTLAPSGSAANTLFRAVHSLEHGYVIVFHKGASSAEHAALTSQFEKARKVIVVPANELGSPMTLVAWRRVQACSRIDVRAAASFVARFREKTAPESEAP